MDSSLKDYYQVIIKIHQGSRYKWHNMDSVVVASVGGKKQRSREFFSTTEPYYNALFKFHMLAEFDAMLDTEIALFVKQPYRFWRSKRILGYVVFDIATIWNQHDHAVYGKWIVLRSPSQRNAGAVTGYLKIDVEICSRFDDPNLNRQLKTQSEMCHLTDVEERKKVNFYFKFYEGEVGVCKNASKTNNLWLDQVRSSYVQVEFAGLKGRTSKQKEKLNPKWDEVIIVTELFPILVSRITFLWVIKTSSSRRRILRKYMKMKNLYVTGGLPVFGPTFLYFYLKNTLGRNYMYAGKILFEIKSERSDIRKSRSVAVDKLPFVNLWDIKALEETSLCCIIHSFTIYDSRYKQRKWSLEFTMGPHSVKLKSSEINKMFNSRQRPCCYLDAEFPNAINIIMLSNMLATVRSKVEPIMEELEEIFDSRLLKHKGPKIVQMMLALITTLKNACIHFLEYAEMQNRTEHKLDDYQYETCRQVMQETIDLCEKSIKGSLGPRDYYKIKTCVRKVQSLENSNMGAWPYIFIYFRIDGERVAFKSLRAEDILYSSKSEGRGAKCGTIQNICLEPIKVKRKKASTFFNAKFKSSKVDLQLWLGLRHQKYSMIDEFPKEFQFVYGPENIPKSLSSNEVHVFQCFAHILIGKFAYGISKNGLCSPYLKMYVRQRVVQSSIKLNILVPVWNETVAINNLEILGPQSFIKNHPPPIMVEVIHRTTVLDKMQLGSFIVHPKITFKNEEYKIPEMQWIRFRDGYHTSGWLMASFEMLEGVEPLKKHIVKGIPALLKPATSKHRVEFLLWGVRANRLLKLNKFKVRIRCAATNTTFDVLTDSHSNFKQNQHFIDVLSQDIPEDEELQPPIVIALYSSTLIKSFKFCGIHMTTISQFTIVPFTTQAWRDNFNMGQTDCNNAFFTLVLASSSTISAILTVSSSGDRSQKLFDVTDTDFGDITNVRSHGIGLMLRKLIMKFKKKSFNSTVEHEEEIDYYNWWVKFYSVTGETDLKCEKYFQTIKVYDNELESEFNDFSDFIASFDVHQGKRSGDVLLDAHNISAVVKANIRVYKWPGDKSNYVFGDGRPISEGYFHTIHSNEPIDYTLRVYVVRAMNLTPKDLNGLADPYITLRLGRTVVTSKKHCIWNELSPVFGRMFEMKGSLPSQYMLKLQIWDFDKVSHDDFIGETEIDIENRIYSKYGALVGLQSVYKHSGIDKWRNVLKPSELLRDLCLKHGITTEILFRNNAVEINKFVVLVPQRNLDIYPLDDVEYTEDDEKQRKCLHVLSNWHQIPLFGHPLVPEHVETRGLVDPRNPGIEMGKVQLWVDIFLQSDGLIPTPIDFSPPQPVEYELRVVIWDIFDVPTTEYSRLVRKYKSDIYIKGWIDWPQNAQHTDVHYRSTTGEGNFNWRFIFNFKYLFCENKILADQYYNIFQKHAVQYRKPCVLNLQVWDSDFFGADNYFGTLMLNLSNLPVGAGSLRHCTLRNFRESSKVNLFKARHIRGYWPFQGADAKYSEYVAGKVDMELEILTKTQSTTNPAGLGRSPPLPLPEPKRPDYSFSFFLSPFRAIRYYIKVNKYRFLLWLFIICFCASCIWSVINLPNLILKKLTGVY